MNRTITITYGESVENHVGNQQIGDKAIDGISPKKLKDIKKVLSKGGFNCELIDLKEILPVEYKDESDDASILVVRNFVNKFFNEKNIDNEIFDKLAELNWDTKVLMKGRVVNKHARYNLCFADFSQEPDYENGKGRVYNFSDLKFLQKIREFLNDLVGVKLNAEGNYYYDTEKCYISYHGDVERSIVVGIRFGSDFPLYYKWYKNYEPISDAKEIILKSGDLYIMSDKAVGCDWKRKIIPTLRHAAGKTSQK
jgi:hypothetical protein